MQAKRNLQLFPRRVFATHCSFDSFPTNTVSAHDWFGNAEALLDFMLEPQNYKQSVFADEVCWSTEEYTY